MSTTATSLGATRFLNSIRQHGQSAVNFVTSNGRTGSQQSSSESDSSIDSEGSSISSMDSLDGKRSSSFQFSALGGYSNQSSMSLSPLNLQQCGRAMPKDTAINNRFESVNSHRASDPFSDDSNSSSSSLGHLTPPEYESQTAWSSLSASSDSTGEKCRVRSNQNLREMLDQVTALNSPPTNRISRRSRTWGSSRYRSKRMTKLSTNTNRRRPRVFSSTGGRFTSNPIPRVNEKTWGDLSFNHDHKPHSTYTSVSQTPKSILKNPIPSTINSRPYSTPIASRRTHFAKDVSSESTDSIVSLSINFQMSRASVSAITTAIASAMRSQSEISNVRTAQTSRTDRLCDKTGTDLSGLVHSWPKSQNSANIVDDFSRYDEGFGTGRDRTRLMGSFRNQSWKAYENGAAKA
ncbi:uncharacterized protein IL334_000017 [Kwoniella shivajii]|uniref:Uncharacterized protein n=1 Tax=Kwoniella shivajii TaxID=564305 RepID=A0ABZ1CMZ3_9TREE|nr:hypothetical protein IL334_000017 [Kwoniella shivajii]